MLSDISDKELNVSSQISGIMNAEKKNRNACDSK